MRDSSFAVHHSAFIIPHSSFLRHPDRQARPIQAVRIDDGAGRRRVEAQFVAERFDFDVVDPRLDRHLQFTFGLNGRDDAIRNVEVGFLAQVLNAARHIAGQTFPREFGRQRRIQRDDDARTRRDGEPLTRLRRDQDLVGREIGRASCRERVFRTV